MYYTNETEVMEIIIPFCPGYTGMLETRNINFQFCLSSLVLFCLIFSSKTIKYFISLFRTITAFYRNFYFLTATFLLFILVLPYTLFHNSHSPGSNNWSCLIAATGSSGMIRGPTRHDPWSDPGCFASTRTNP